MKDKKLNKYLWTEILQGEHRSIVYGYDYYPPSSVLAGQYRRNFIESFPSVEEAQAAYPNTEIGHTLMQPQNSFNHLDDREGSY